MEIPDTTVARVRPPLEQAPLSSASTIATIQLGEMRSLSASAFCGSPLARVDRAKQRELARLDDSGSSTSWKRREIA